MYSAVIYSNLLFNSCRLFILPRSCSSPCHVPCTRTKLYCHVPRICLIGTSSISSLETPTLCGNLNCNQNKTRDLLRRLLVSAASASAQPKCSKNLIQLRELCSPLSTSSRTAADPTFFLYLSKPIDLSRARPLSRLDREY